MPLERTDRGVPYHFAGRDAELSALNSRLAVVAETGDASDGLALITGVPGSGKTSLARAFMESCNVHTLRCDVVDFEDPPSLFLNIGTAIGKQSAFEKIAGVDPRITGGGLSSGIASVASAKVSGTRQQTRPNLGLTAMLCMSKPKWEKPLLLVVDELQNLEASQAKPLRTLHEGVHGCPILAVGAGLRLQRHPSRPAVQGRYARSDLGVAGRFRHRSPDDRSRRTRRCEPRLPAAHPLLPDGGGGHGEDRKDWHRPSIMGKVVTKGDALRADTTTTGWGQWLGTGTN